MSLNKKHMLYLLAKLSISLSKKCDNLYKYYVWIANKCIKFPIKT